MVTWLGGTTCDFCKADCRETGVLYDAKTIYGPWATMCEDCWKIHTRQKLGTGMGQKYVLQNGMFVKKETL